ncbi:hypothetical protein KPL78_22945 [Roseomonas sp. HJA6]|uniref:Uncharacterized protein n=1 Tax=Roseomonas alba TaxID=2846776 RepID=A0ABS7AEK7_9PROT|nr:DUF6653 family protein [Neoroseomonas alba]MBW6400736.1 hypothetical protein [Neoroseomonas alba]
MTLERRIAAAFCMDAAAWARHTNPWSGWTRVPALPLLALAIWSRAWLGWWALVPMAVLLAWLWVNPRLFPPPRDETAWMTRGVLGERLWLARDETPVPAHHRRAPNILSAIGATGVLLAIGGLAMRAGWIVIAGVAVAMLAKLWFIDRMVWLHQDMTKEGE